MKEGKVRGLLRMAVPGCVLLLALVSLPGTSSAQEPWKGQIPEGPRLGPFFGDPLGAAFGIFLTDNIDLQSGMGYDLSNGFLWFVDGLFHVFPSNDPKNNLNSISPYIGLGFGTGMLAAPAPAHDQAQVNMRFPIGCSYLIPKINSYVFGQVVIEAQFVPDVDAGVSGGAGFQIVF